MKANESIFRAYDIRGVYPDDFDDEFAFRLGNAVTVSLGAKHLIVGKDGRTSSEGLAKQVIAGAQAAGADVTWLSKCSVPLFYFSVDASGADGGIMVTASHNPGEYNGFKVEKRKPGGGTELINGPELKQFLEQARPVQGGQGSVSQRSFVHEYAKHIVSLVGGKVAPTLAGIQGPLGTEEVLHAIAELAGLRVIIAEPARLIADFDDDGDRIVFVEDGKRIPPEFVFLLLTEHLGFKSVVHDVRFSRAIRERLQELEVAATESRAGRRYLRQAMEKAGADFGGELSGHFFFRSMGDREAPEMVLMHILNIIAKEQKTLAELIGAYQRYFKTAEISLPVTEGVLERVKEKYAGGKISMLDGVTVDFWDVSQPAGGGWWFNLRLAQTEPVMRLVVEAKTKELLDQRVQELKAALHG